MALEDLFPRKRKDKMKREKTEKLRTLRINPEVSISIQKTFQLGDKMAEKELSRNYKKTFPRIKEHDSQVLRESLHFQPNE